MCDASGDLSQNAKIGQVHSLALQLGYTLTQKTAILIGESQREKDHRDLAQ